MPGRRSVGHCGETEPIDPKLRSYPGRLADAPFAGNVSNGRFLPGDALAERYRRPKECEATEPTAVYCGSGVTAAHDLLALTLAGYPAALLYPGSWSEWARDPKASGGSR